MKIVYDELINYVVQQQKNQGGLLLLLSPNQFSLEQEPCFPWLVGIYTALLFFFFFQWRKTVAGGWVLELGIDSFGLV
jgi:hypothetical protein